MRSKINSAADISLSEAIRIYKENFLLKKQKKFYYKKILSKVNWKYCRIDQHQLHYSYLNKVLFYSTDIGTLLKMDIEPMQTDDVSIETDISRSVENLTTLQRHVITQITMFIQLLVQHMYVHRRKPAALNTIRIFLAKLGVLYKEVPRGPFRYFAFQNLPEALKMATDSSDIMKFNFLTRFANSTVCHYPAALPYVRISPDRTKIFNDSQDLLFLTLMQHIPDFNSLVKVISICIFPHMNRNTILKRYSELLYNCKFITFGDVDEEINRQLSRIPLGPLPEGAVKRIIDYPNKFLPVDFLELKMRNLTERICGDGIEGILNEEKFFGCELTSDFRLVSRVVDRSHNAYTLGVKRRRLKLSIIYDLEFIHIWEKYIANFASDQAILHGAGHDEKNNLYSVLVTDRGIELHLLEKSDHEDMYNWLFRRLYLKRSRPLVTAFPKSSIVPFNNPFIHFAERCFHSYFLPHICEEMSAFKIEYNLGSF
ncbi:hypothetical protein T4B_12545 [Trichinella pseudospiralis]|uniref:Uncharacterized protein n=1 Tax=Trichinella pseudospiralis TaxID=6337 RepID=A0A0V1EA03_TRIPS|nr:hypothetical protein T4E_5588 [Trichinella pseudospiralis]KRY70426.1 hypothetical protein T4A_9969 [Trichinella pseudospiralis]KRZ25009.1 hypothetical protein T4B_12545 [Trichinella pseudospiralis]KRZ34451.1 hypothetical protein T4C_8011 [Trichinella pseudospiralis]